jgi:hypothetical protein
VRHGQKYPFKISKRFEHPPQRLVFSLVIFFQSLPPYQVHQNRKIGFRCIEIFSCPLPHKLDGEGGGEWGCGLDSSFLPNIPKYEKDSHGRDWFLSEHPSIALFPKFGVAYNNNKKDLHDVCTISHKRKKSTRRVFCWSCQTV